MFGLGKVNKIHFRDFDDLSLSFKNGNDEFKNNNIYADPTDIKLFTSKKRGDTLYITAKKIMFKKNISLFLTYDVKHILASNSKIKIINKSKYKTPTFRKADLPSELSSINLENSKFTTDNLISPSVSIKLKKNSFFWTKNIMSLNVSVECYNDSFFKVSDGYILKSRVVLNKNSKAIFEQGTYISDMLDAKILKSSYMRCNVLDSIKCEAESITRDLLIKSINLYGVPKMEGYSISKKNNKRYFRPLILEQNIPEENDRVYLYKGNLDFSEEELTDCYDSNCVKMPKSISKIHKKSIEGISAYEKDIADSIGFDYPNLKTKVLTKNDYKKVIKNFHNKVADQFKDQKELTNNKEKNKQHNTILSQQKIINNASPTQKSSIINKSFQK